MKNKIPNLFLSVFFFFSTVYAKEYHVSVSGNVNHTGSIAQPFRIISKASEVAQSGDKIIVYRGTYREWVDPQRGGSYPDKRIVYHAAENEKVIIKGSEVIKVWKKFRGKTRKNKIPNTFFGEYNPYKDLLRTNKQFKKNGK